MDTLIFGAGHLGRAIADALVARGEPVPALLGRPGPDGRDPAGLRAADVVFDASRGDAVYANVAAAIDAGGRRFVIGTTGWDADRPDVETLLARHGASAVAAANLSIGVVLFGRLVEQAVRMFGPFEDVDPYLVEWHRRSKVDRPSGTARDLVRRVLATHPRKRRLAEPGSDRSPAPDELELAVVRAGASPGCTWSASTAPGGPRRIEPERLAQRHDGERVVDVEPAGETEVEVRFAARRRDRDPQAAGVLHDARRADVGRRAPCRT